MNSTAGQPSGFEDRLDELYWCASRAALRILGNPDDAADIGREAVVRAYVHWKRIERYAEPWVTRVAANLAISEIRRRKRAGEIGMSVAAPPVSIDDASVDRIVLNQAIATLSKRQREVITLRYLLDLPEAEVAEMLGFSTGSVSRHTARALAHLRSAMVPLTKEVASND